MRHRRPCVTELHRKQVGEYWHQLTETRRVESALVDELLEHRHQPLASPSLVVLDRPAEQSAQQVQKGPIAHTHGHV